MALPPHLLPGLCAVDKAERILHELLFDVAALHAQRAAATLRELIAACDEAHRQASAVARARPARSTWPQVAPDPRIPCPGPLTATRKVRTDHSTLPHPARST